MIYMIDNNFEKICKQCNKIFYKGNNEGKNYFETRKFCSHSCSAIYSNSRRGKKESKYCLNCGEEIPNTNKYCSHLCQVKYQQKEWENKWLSGEISGIHENDHWGNIPDRIRTYLFNNYNNKCSICGWGETNPYTNKIPLEVEHIDGDGNNNRPENLTLLCPNCHSLTSTYRGANRNKSTRKKTWIPENK